MTITATPPELLAIVCMGALVGVAVRWILGLSLSLHWAVVLGVAMVLLKPWFSTHMERLLNNPDPASLVVAGGAVVALLSVAQAVGGR